MEQKFKRGNLVKVLVGSIVWTLAKNGVETIVQDIRPGDVGRKAVIEYSYADRFGGNNVDSYSVIFLDTGNSLAWKRTNELELVEEGGEHLFEEASKILEAKVNERIIKNKLADEDFKGRIDGAIVDHEKAVDLYRSYVGTAETMNERKRRIHNFRSGGSL